MGNKAWGVFCLMVICIGLPQISVAKSSRQERLENTFLLRHKTTGKLAEFYATTTEQATLALQEAGLPIAKSACSAESFPEPGNIQTASAKEDSKLQERVMKGLELSILIEAFDTRKQMKLTDPQRSLIASLDLCDVKTRNALRALALMVQDYELLKAGDI